ncbi:hypothetical protein JHK82_049837 [Glycine max]|nr:hypothetical protein JHK86_049709 [Glycine max]KAG4935540.1 hypothetical protein JHK85_050459 [Glycine max]KAG5091059.1 hypothetical protein JHK82_049837 [Glycine max]KAG5094158.1 hypothetical protein JHK84_049746 [Glycine max]
MAKMVVTSLSSPRSYTMMHNTEWTFLPPMRRECFYLDIESVYLDSNHQGWLKILVVSCFGVFENKNADAWTDFVTLLKFRGINMDKIGHANPIIVTVVTSIIEPLGEYPLRKELIGTPSRFVVKWLQ